MSAESIEKWQTRVDTLNDALATGVRSVTLGGQTIIYNTTESLIKARDDALKQLNGEKDADAGRVRPRYVQVVHGGRGY